MSSIQQWNYYAKSSWIIFIYKIYNNKKKVIKFIFTFSLIFCSLLFVCIVLFYGVYYCQSHTFFVSFLFLLYIENTKVVLSDTSCLKHRCCIAAECSFLVRLLVISWCSLLIHRTLISPISCISWIANISTCNLQPVTWAVVMALLWRNYLLVYDRICNVGATNCASWAS